MFHYRDEDWDVYEDGIPRLSLHHNLFAIEIEFYF